MKRIALALLCLAGCSPAKPELHVFNWADYFAPDTVKNFEKEVLLSRSRFFSDVYRPKRDEFANKWTEMSSREGKKKILKVIASSTTRRRTKKRT